jgi:O-antigen/teichoic acid export membrane protein
MTASETGPEPIVEAPTVGSGGGLRRTVGRAIAKVHKAAASVSAEVIQSATSFLLSLIAVRELGAGDLGVFVLLYNCVVLATSVTTGLIGDSLTVLDRERREVRGGLQVVSLGVAACGGLLAMAITGATGLLDWGLTPLMGLATTVFVLEELIRRMLMASMRFWFVVAVDSTCFVVTLIWLLGFRMVDGELVMRDLLASLFVAQLVGMAVGIVLLPKAEQWWAPMRRSRWQDVLRYGGWRAAQQAVRPSVMAAARVIVIIAVGETLFGQLEAARVYAPAALIVNGAGGFLFASYANRRKDPLRDLIPLADRGTVLLVGLSFGLGAVSIVLMPWLGPIITNDKFDLNGVAVFGWSVYAAATAVIMPYGSLAAVRGRQAAVMGTRVVEAAVSLVSLLLVLGVFGAAVWWAPYAMALGSVSMGLAIRQLILVPSALDEERGPRARRRAQEPAGSAAEQPSAEVPGPVVRPAASEPSAPGSDMAAARPSAWWERGVGDGPVS